MISQFINSQENINCNVNYKAEIIECPKETTNAEKYGIINQDFSEV
jgi:hypothetical protein